MSSLSTEYQEPGNPNMEGTPTGNAYSSSISKDTKEGKGKESKDAREKEMDAKDAKQAKPAKQIIPFETEGMSNYYVFCFIFSLISNPIILTTVSRYRSSCWMCFHFVSSNFHQP